MTCPRCRSTDVDAETLTCRACRIAYTDNPRTFEPHTREHTMVSKRWEGWRERAPGRERAAKRRVEEFLGLR